MHIRKQIRDKFETILTGLATTGSNVFASRVYPLDTRKDLPALVIINDKDEVRAHNPRIKQPRLQERRMGISVYGVASDPKLLDDVLDTIAEEVETVLFLNPTLDGLVLQTELVNIEAALSAEGDEPHGRIRMQFECIANTKEGEPNKDATK